MADFVAVIRRTVDGLSENNPEMRGRVYEKARSAVRRQLENMTPRPSDDMINRQLNKLEAAITEVESEHAEALPAIEETEAPETPEVLEPAAVEAPAEQEPALPVSPEPEPVSAEAAEAEQTAAEERIEEAAPEAREAFEEPTAAEEVAPTAEHEAADHREAEPVEASSAEQYEESSAVSEEPEAAPAEPQWSAPAEEQTAAEDVETWQQAPAEQVGPPEPRADEVEHAEPAAEPEPVVAAGEEEPVSEEAPPVEAEPAKQAPSEWALPEWEDVPSSARPGEEPPAPEAPREEAATVPERLGMHPVEAETGEPAPRANEAETAQAWSFDDSDPFAAPTEAKKDKPAEPDVSEWAWPVEKPPAAANEDERAGTAWDHIDDLLGFDEAGRKANGPAAVAQEEENGSDVAPAALSPRPTSYRVSPKPSRFGVKKLVIGALILLLLGGGGVAYWVNREAGNAWLSAMLAKIIPAGPETQTPPAGEGEPAVQPGEQPGTQDETALPEDKSSKFTQRLLADGTERDEGPAGVNGTEVSQEGKSVAPQTDAGEPQSASTGGQQAAAQTPQPAAQDGGAPQTEVSIADGEKMFLYEERLGQSSPTAVPGTVAWSLKEESPGGDAKPEPAIQAQITVPDRGLTALMTIKRNVDPSLPASHVIEFVFSLPENFEGGSIEGVQRVSMKRTEQDRGDPLIAVPAKITDDFHMIALNDFAEAVGSNIELLRSRSWIDIPITYRNGRRALLTLEKGASGTEAFTKAMQAWSSLGSAAAASGQ